MSVGYRVHPAGEPIETCLLSDRPDGWVVEGDRQLPGVACCRTLVDLANYVKIYGMDVAPGDLVVRVEGYSPVDGGIDDREVRIEGTSVELIGNALEVLASLHCPAGCEDIYGEPLLMEEDFRGELECPGCGARR